MAVEPAGVQPTELTWRKSNACDPSECVEVAICGDHVLIRDSAAPTGLVLEFSQHAWQAFVKRVKHDVDHHATE
jgi:hypothetical protein